VPPAAQRYAVGPTRRGRRAIPFLFLCRVPETPDLRQMLRKFKRAASALRDGLQAFGDDASLHFSSHFQAGAGTTAAFDENSKLIRFAALLRPFMGAESPINVRRVWETLAAEAELLVEPTIRETMAQNFVTVEDIGIGVSLNQEPLTASKLYWAYAEGEFFGRRRQRQSGTRRVDIRAC